MELCGRLGAGSASPLRLISTPDRIGFKSQVSVTPHRVQDYIQTPGGDRMGHMPHGYQSNGSSSNIISLFWQVVKLSSSFNQGAQGKESHIVALSLFVSPVVHVLSVGGQLVCPD